MNTPESAAARLVSTRTMDIVVAVLLLAVSAVVIKDSLRVGVEWHETEGPQAGYFPFYIGVMLALASVINLAKAVIARERAGKTFVSRPAARKVLAVLVPLAIYVVAVGFIGIYAASAVYIALFMRYVGGYSLLRGVPVGLGVTGVLFLMFEIWFLVPLPKGPVERLLGY